MGFEILYHYHERQEDGKYNTEEVKEMKKKVGNPTDDIPLEQVAATIRAQLARRKIWVVDVEIYEFTKKKISFKEADDGSIVIKNKKFSPNSTAVEWVGSDVEEDAPAVEPEDLLAKAKAMGLQPHQVMAMANRNGNQVAVQQPNLPNVNLAARPRPVEYWVFDPDPVQQIRLKNSGLKLTPGKRYAVHHVDSPTEAQAMMGATQVFHVDDDNGRRKKVASEYFMTATQGRLVGDDEVEGGFSQPVARQQQPRLSFESSFIEDQKTQMPDLRGRGKPAPQMPMVDPRLAGIDPRMEAYSEAYEEEYIDDMPDIRSGR
jgi:hypothetical protein